MKTIHHYTIQAEIGQGGMSKVYRAYDPMQEREVAIKLMSEELSGNEKARARFVQEAQMVMAMAHPAIVPVWDHGEVDGRLYIVMPYLPGGSLRQHLENAPLPFEQCVIITERIAWALDAAHAENIIHRDVKPHNILLDEQGQAFLADFGVARLMDEEGTDKTVTMVGTPEFIAPEQGLDGKLTTQADVYQLGATLFYMLTGQQPFNGSSFQLIAQHMSQPVPSAEALNPSLPAGTDAILQRAMAKAPLDRYQTAGALALALANLNGDGEVTQLFAPPPEWLQSEVPVIATLNAVAAEVSTPLAVVADTTQVPNRRRRFTVATAVLILTILTVFTLSNGQALRRSLTQDETFTTQTVLDDIPQADTVPDGVDTESVVEPIIVQQAEPEITLPEIISEPSESDEPINAAELDNTGGNSATQETAVAATNNNFGNNTGGEGNNDGNNRRGGNGNNGGGGNRGNGNGRPPRNGPPPPPPPPLGN